MNIRNNLLFINDKITRAAKLYQQNPEEITVIAVSKKVEPQRIIEAINSGCKNFGENYLQEAQEKWPLLKENFPETKLHFIGHLQSNKAAAALDLFDSIHSVDSKKLALEIKKAAIKKQKNPEIFIQVNIGQELQKGGVAPQELEDFVKFIRDECALNLVGLMCIPPEGESPAPYFALLHEFAKKNNLKKLSMGMSADYEVAIAMGANYVRIGTMIFGKREIGVP